MVAYWTYTSSNTTYQAYAKITNIDRSTNKLTFDKSMSASYVGLSITVCLGAASGPTTHVEGMSNIASADYAHAEGYFNEASGLYSHAQGNHTIASGKFSDAGGL